MKIVSENQFSWEDLFLYNCPQILFKGFDVHVYTSHYHAEYDRKHDVYLGHRVLHALESAEWIRLSSSSADLTIYAGDFNTEPTDVPYKMLRDRLYTDRSSRGK